MAGSALIGRLAVVLGLETAAFQKGATIAEKRAEQLNKKLSGFGSKITGIGAAVSAGLTLPFTALMTKAIPAALESADALGQVNAALTSMGPVAGRTSEQLQKAATQLMHLSTFDDDDILRNVTANLLTFGRITGQQFDQAQLAVVNLATRLKMDLQPAAILVGKALNDPVKGMAAMGRAGIQFSEDQKAAIKAMVETGNVAGAQSIILGELKRQFGGAAEAARKAKPGQDLINAWNDFQEVVGAIAVKVLPILTPMLTSLLEKFNALSPSTQTWLVGIVAVGAALGPLMLALGPVLGAMGTLLPLVARLAPLFAALLPLIASLARALLMLAVAGGPLTLIALAVGAVYLAWQNWDKIAPILKALYEAAKTWLMDKLGKVLNFVKGQVEALIAPFKMLYDAVVGHSYVPDMVDRIAQEFGRLDGIMVDPALTATEAAARGFAKMAESVLGSLQSILSAVRSGDWLSAVKGAIELLSRLGVLGSGSYPAGGIDPTLPDIPGMAAGGIFRIGGRGGIDRNMLSLNGSPVARVSRGESVSVSPGGGRGGTTIINMHGVITNDQFWAEVDRRDQVSMQAGSTMTVNRIGRARRQALA